MVQRPRPDREKIESNFRVVEVGAHDPDLIARVIEIDLTTFSEPTWSRYTAGLMLRHGRTYLLMEEELIIGTCQVVRSWERPSEAVLFSMAIRPGYRNRGLGSYFLESVLEMLRKAGARSVVLEVDPHKRAAIKVYTEKFGFQRVCELADEYGPGHHRVQMRLVLSGEVREVVSLDLALPASPPAK
jgi:ribosomal-protein-alanine N-acetyltransferase